MQGIAIKVASKLEKDLETLSGLMFDGWTHGDGTHTADTHVGLSKNILDVYNKIPQMIGFFVSNNCNTNQLIANKVGVQLVACARHWVNLAVSKFLAPYEDLTAKHAHGRTPS
ncbi:hypothetical protein PHMEG_00019725 [Phytophthora megakarya]|uniref:Uncharacterized protein n=1 Tax=Phytophthora megakarya TaxID=4795 RepID=A0A225VR78_9STRA|nr:hypothetical protein PHMEG_00019725 [Phytophthora megakarya]